jgi:hypothetical protein
MCVAVGLLAVAGAPAACLFPSYTFDRPADGGSNDGEDCTNGIDDNDDGLIDCQDPGCSGVSCVAAIPMGWQGYVALYDGPPAKDPGCGGDFPRSVFTGHGSLQDVPAKCSTCTCGAPQSQTCAIPDIVVSDATCTGAPSCTPSLPVPPGWDGTCNDVTSLPGGVTTCGTSCTTGSSACHVSVRAATPVVTGGSCTPSTQKAVIPATAWGAAGEACAANPNQAAGCAPGQACLPKPSGLFEKGLCIYQTGDSMCPGQFTQKHVFYQDATDTRACTDCACDAPAGSICVMNIKVYAGATCTGGLLQSFTAGGCASLLNNPAVGAHQATVAQPPTGGMCAATGGQAMGTQAPTSPTTFCCIP